SAQRDGCRPGQRGFALLALLGLVGMFGIGALLVAQRLVPTSAQFADDAEDNVVTVERAARVAFRRNGAFPANLASLAAAAGLDSTARWRTDPWLPPTDLDWRRPSTGATVRSRGADRRLGTVDDVTATILAEDLVRARQRGRLRMLRAVLLRSQYFFAAGMGATEIAAMRTAMHQNATARRSWVTADTTARVALQATLDDSAATIAGLRSAYSCPAIPTRIVGAGGLMTALGIPDSRAVDGIGRRLVRDVSLGVAATGYDRRRNTDDDM
ncbi:MAG: hypothetical protein JNK78_12915, partial [Planctomycetes bacterium]|nr:hypothetical protein [Planctomycetota bacterium]